MIPTILVKPLLELAAAGIDRLVAAVKRKPKPPPAEALTFRDVTHIQDQIKKATSHPNENQRSRR
jgi:hypothetical protein